MRNAATIVAGLAALWWIGPAVAGPPSAEPVQLAQDVRPLVSGERVRVQKLARDIEGAMDTLNRGGVAPFQDPAYAARWNATVERYRGSLDRYPQDDDPDVQAAAAKLAELANMVAFGVRQGGAQTAGLGDVQAKLAEVEAALRARRAPQWLPAPFDEAEARAWVAAAAAAKRTAQAAGETLQQIAASAHLPVNPGTVQQGAPYDSRDVDRLARFAADTVRDVDAAVKETLEALKTQFQAQDRELGYYRSLDLADEQHRMNAFLREGAEAEIYAGLDRQRALAESVVAYQVALGREPTPASTARVEEISRLRTAYAAARVEAVGASRLPAPKSEDEARLAIARAILAEPSYEFGEHGPIVLTTPDIVERQETVSRAEIKNVDVSLSGTITLSGSETTWNYAWEEFKFATPLRSADGGDWYVWWVTAKKYSSGWERTPIGRWVSGAATQGDLILEENFR